MANENVRPPVIGSIRRDVGNGCRFCQALRIATVDELKQALGKIESYPRGRCPYTYYHERTERIKHKLAKKMNEETTTNASTL